MTELLTISVVSSYAQAKFGALQSIDLDRFRREAESAVRASGAVQWAFFGVDLSWNEQIEKGLGSFWQYQLYAVASVHDRDALFRGLRVVFGRCVTVGKPVDLDDFDGSALGASYVCKTQFWRRISYWDRRAQPPCWQTSYRALKAKQAVELALALDAARLDARVLTFRLQASANPRRFRARSLE